MAMKRLRALGVACLLAASPTWAAEAWPTGVVRVITPFPPGGTADIAARLVAAEFSKSFGQQFVVENRPGANTVIGTDAVAKAKPDGQTLLVTSGPYSVIATLLPKLPFDPLNDLAPVALILQTPMLLVATPGVPMRTFQDVVSFARAKPKELTFASAGVGTISHMAIEYMAGMANVQVTHVPYKGTGQIMPDLLGGQVQFFYDNANTSIGHVRAGKLRAMVTTGAKRVAALPEVPTAIEAGYPGFVATNWFGLMAPAQTPSVILDRLHQETLRIVKRPEIVERFAKEAADVGELSRAEYAQFVRDDIARWGRIIRERGIRAE